MKQKNKDSCIYSPGWDIKRVKLATISFCGYWIDEVYNYNSINNAYSNIKQIRKSQGYYNKDLKELPVFDPYMWEEFVETLESGRKFIEKACIDEGINEVESHFLSIKWTINTVTKFRNKFFKSINNETDEFGLIDRKNYDNTALKEVVNILITRLKKIEMPEDYIWSKEVATNGQLSQFKKEASWEIARELAEDTGVILHAKLMLW